MIFLCVNVPKPERKVVVRVPECFELRVSGDRPEDDRAQIQRDVRAQGVLTQVLLQFRIARVE
jgi:hypothetical protein